MSELPLVSSPDLLNQNVYFSKSPMWFLCTLKFEKHCPRGEGAGGDPGKGQVREAVRATAPLKKLSQLFHKYLHSPGLLCLPQGPPNLCA